MIRKIAITGPESTGKSTLAKKLALYFDTVCVPEFARLYLDGLGRAYTAEDIEEIAKGQLQSEQNALSAAKGVLFCDTDLLVIKVWLENAFGFCPDWIVEEIKRKHYDLHLLMNVDIPWEPDPQREHPHLREYFFDLYREELIKFNLPFREVSGIGEERFQNAISIVEDFLRSK